MDKEEIKSRIEGCLIGQAVGNALGLFTEFMDKEAANARFSPKLEYYSQGSSSGLGVWEDDDTLQALCIVDELRANRGIKAESLGKRLRHWLETDGRGCGNLVYNVLMHPDYLTDPVGVAKKYWSNTGCNAAPNGALMRTAPIGLWNRDVARNAETACTITHHDPRCVGSCVIVSLLINGLVYRWTGLSYDRIMEIADSYDPRIAEWVETARYGTLEDFDLDNPGTIGYTLRTLGAVLWAYWHAETFKDGLVAIVNEAGDADTNAAIACAVLGAKFGIKGIPSYYIDNLANIDLYKARIAGLIKAALDENSKE